MTARADSIPIVVATPTHAARAVALEIALLLRERAQAGRATVLGLATGRTPLGIYAELVRLRRDEGLDFGGVVAFGLDEYLGPPPAHPLTCGAYLRERVLGPLGIEPARARLLASDVPDAERDAHCRAFERALADAGGIDLQLLGIGRNGHIGFNEPGSPRASRTREVRLAPETREDAAAAFGGIERVPERALTQGIATILEARRIRVLAFGERKREAVRRVLEGPIGPALPATFLRAHPDARLYTDFAG